MSPNDRIKELRRLIANLGWTHIETAENLELTVRTLQYWLSKRRPVPITAIYSLRYLEGK